jgi:hypothetical protein
MQDALVQFALREATARFAERDWPQALEWLSRVPEAARPVDLVATANAWLA